MRNRSASWCFVIEASLFVLHTGAAPVLAQDSTAKYGRTLTSQSFSIPEERAVGSKEAPIVIEVFSDFQCAGCAQFYLQTLSRVIQDYCEKGQVYLIHREYPVPVPSHRYSREAARWALASAGIGQYERVAAVLLRNQSMWAKSGDIEATIGPVLTPAELASIKKAMRDDGDKVDSALEHDISIGHSFPVHGVPSFRILVHGTETFADHDEPEKILPTDPNLKLYPNLKHYLDQQLAK